MIVDAYGKESDAGWWCQDDATICPEVWWCGLSGILLSTLVGCCIWAGLFGLLCVALRPVSEAINERWPSKIEDEQQVSWCALHVQSTLHALLLVWMVLGPLWDLFSASPRAQFDAPSVTFLMYRPSIALLGNASHIFFCYTIVDTFVTFWRKSMTVDYFVHHMVFIFFCVLIQYDCFAPYLAGWLLVMEVSTIFLNGFTYWRNRLGYGHIVVRVFFVFFGVTFFIFRLAGTLYIARHWVTTLLRGEVPFTGIPRWHLYVLCVALVGAVGLQIFWAMSIAGKLAKVFVAKPGDEKDDRVLLRQDEEGGEEGEESE